MNPTSGTTPVQAPAQEQPNAQATDQPAGVAAGSADGLPGPETDGFRFRGRARRRARFLRKARELAYRDLGGLVFNLHRFGQRNDPLVLAKLTTLEHLDAELRSIERSLGEQQPLTVLREAGITACPRCAAIHSSEDNFCPNCGLSLGRHADLPAGFQSAPAAAPAPAALAPTAASVPSTPAASTAPAATAAAAPSTAASVPSAPAAPAAAAPQPAPAPAPSESRASAPAPSSGRSPTPPTSRQAAQAPAAPLENEDVREEGPTEILRPPVSGS
ncbi:MAG TPA: zinc ribbon domain-containing protein [Solirubrobacteraceae bacterium]|nr:zinc ribbon domain-containing protein [Solirubrobacteraceae bacterium]